MYDFSFVEQTPKIEQFKTEQRSSKLKLNELLKGCLSLTRIPEYRET